MGYGYAMPPFGQNPETADGGKVAPLDIMISSDGPARFQASPEAHRLHEERKRKEEQMRAQMGMTDPKVEREAGMLARKEDAERERHARDSHRRMRKSFAVTERTRFGGTGLLGGEEE